MTGITATSTMIVTTTIATDSHVRHRTPDAIAGVWCFCV
jgi:hypothetical protein